MIKRWKCTVFGHSWSEPYYDYAKDTCGVVLCKKCKNCNRVDYVKFIPQLKEM